MSASSSFRVSRRLSISSKSSDEAPSLQLQKKSKADAQFAEHQFDAKKGAGARSGVPTTIEAAQRAAFLNPKPLDLRYTPSFNTIDLWQTTPAKPVPYTPNVESHDHEYICQNYTMLSGNRKTFDETSLDQVFIMYNIAYGPEQPISEVVTNNPGEFLYAVRTLMSQYPIDTVDEKAQQAHMMSWMKAVERAFEYRETGIHFAPPLQEK